MEERDNRKSFMAMRAAAERYKFEVFQSRWCVEVANTYSLGGRYLIHYLIGRSSFEIFKFALENGLDPNLNTSWGVSPLLYSAGYHEDRPCQSIKLLLQHGANPYLMNPYRGNAFNYMMDADHEALFEGYLFVDLVCGEADNLSLDLWRVIRSFTYSQK